MSRLLVFGSHNVYIGVVESQTEPMSFGKLAAELQLTKRNGLIIGLRTPSGKEVINPPRAFIVEPGTHLLYLAEEALLQPPP